MSSPIALRQLFPAHRSRECLRRINAPDGGWCILVDNHDGECVGYPSREASEPPDLTHRTVSKRWG